MWVCVCVYVCVHITHTITHHTHAHTHTHTYTHTHTHTSVADAHLLSLSLEWASQRGRMRQSATAQAKGRSCKSVKVLPVAFLQRVRERVRGPRDAPSQGAVDKHRVRAAVYLSPCRAPPQNILERQALAYLLCTVTIQRGFENLLPVEPPLSLPHHRVILYRHHHDHRLGG